MGTQNGHNCALSRVCIRYEKQTGQEVVIFLSNFCFISYGTSEIFFNPFASTGRTGTSEGKAKVRDICLTISFLT